MNSANFLAGSIIAKLVMDKSGWTSSIQSVMKDGAKLSGMSAKTAQGFRTAGSIISTAGVAIVGALSLCIKEAMEFGKVEKQLNAVIASTGGAAGITAEAAKDLSEEMQKVTTFTHDTVLGGENLLLTFTKIGKDIFPAATETMLDMSTALGQDLKSSAIQLGKALQDPVLGVTALRRVGVNFTKDQQAMIKVLVDSGHELDAQKIILKELAVEFGGSARAAAGGFGGQMKQLKNEIKDTQEEIGMMLMPILKEMVGKIKPIIESVKNWIKEHPELTKQIAGTALKVGILFLALGPLLMIIPKIVAVFGLMKGGVLSFVGAIKGLGAPLAATKFGLGQIALIGAAAFVGWKIGRAIADMLGLDKAIEGAFTKALDFLGVAQGLNVEWQKGHAAAAAKQQEVLAAAFDKTGIHAKTQREAIDLLEPIYLKLGTTGSATVDKIVKGHIDAGKATIDHKGAVDGLRPSVEGLETDYYGLAGEIKAGQEAQKAFTDYMKEIGVQTIAEQKDAVKDLNARLLTLNELHRTGKIDDENYQKGVLAINTELAKYKANLLTILPPARDLTDVWEKASDTLEDADYWTDRYGKVMERLGGRTIGQVKEETRKLLKEQMLLTELWKAGDLSGSAYTAMMDKLQKEMRELGQDEGVKQSQDDYKSGWEGVFSDLSSAFGDTFKTFVETWSWDKIVNGKINFKAFFKDIWGNIKDTFFRLVGDMAAKWAMSLLTDMISPTKAVGSAIVENVGGALSTVGTSVSTLGTTIGGVFTGLAGAIGTVITTLATAIATGIVAIAGAIAGAIVALATGIATAATALAAAAPSLLVVGAVAVAIYAGFSAIKALLGSGGGGAGDGMGRVVERQDKFLAGWSWWYLNVVEILAFTQGQNDHRADQLDHLSNVLNILKDDMNVGLNVLAVGIYKIVDAINSVPSAAGGGVFTKPTFARIAENAPRIPEAVVPLDRLSSVANVESRGANVSLSMNANFEIKTMDGSGVRDIVRAKIGPELIGWLKTNFGKDQLRAALGV